MYADESMLTHTYTAAAMKTAVTAPPMVAVLAAVPEMLCCSESNIWEQ